MNQPALLLIDVQQGFDDPYWGRRNNHDAEQNMAQLLQVWRAHRWPVIHVQHLSTNPNSPLNSQAAGCAFKPATAPLADEVVFTKHVNSAFIGTGLESYLHEEGIHSLVIAGLTTDHCVSTTTRMAGNLGFKVQLVSDGTATFDREDVDGRKLNADEIHRVHLASLHGEFCTVVTTNELLAKM
jgi:nicotinamidase-related amidase